MVRKLRPDLMERMQEAHEKRSCVIAQSPSDARRLRNAAKRGALTCPMPQLYVLPELWNELSVGDRELSRIRGLSALHPNWVFSSYSAALVHGLCVSYKLLRNVHVARDRKSTTRSRGAIQRHTVTGDERTIVDGVPVTSLARTVYDAVNACSFPEGLAIADSALRVTGMSSDELARKLEPFGGSRRAVETAALANGLAESGGESIARAVMITQGYMPAKLQVKVPSILDPGDDFRIDFYWELESGNVAGELDGHEKYTNPSMMQGRNFEDVVLDERLRESRVTGANVKVMRFSYANVRDTELFCRLLTKFGIPKGYPIPRVALSK